MSTPWSPLGSGFLSDGDWGIGQGTDAPDRQLFRALLGHYAEDYPFVLDVGFGPGIDADAIIGSDLDVAYEGYDATEELVVRAINRHPDATWRVCDVLDMSNMREFDVVWARHLLEHVSDGERALANLWRATRGVLLISWFIRPSFSPSEVGCVEAADGFQHWTYDAPRWIRLCREMGAHLVRLDFDHHATKASVWMLSREEQPELTEIAHSFVASQAFLDACIPVPPVVNAPYEDALDGVEEALAVLDAAIPVAERLDAALYVVREAYDALFRAESLLAWSQDEDGVGSVITPVREAKARCEIILAGAGGHGDGQALRDAARRIEARLQDAGRI